MKQVKTIIYFVSFLMMAAGFTLLVHEYGFMALIYGVIASVGVALNASVDEYSCK